MDFTLEFKIPDNLYYHVAFGKINKDMIDFHVDFLPNDFLIKDKKVFLNVPYKNINIVIFSFIKDQNVKDELIGHMTLLPEYNNMVINTVYTKYDATYIKHLTFSISVDNMKNIITNYRLLSRYASISDYKFDDMILILNK